MELPEWLKINDLDRNFQYGSQEMDERNRRRNAFKRLNELYEQEELLHAITTEGNDLLLIQKQHLKTHELLRRLRVEGVNLGVANPKIFDNSVVIDALDHFHPAYSKTKEKIKAHGGLGQTIADILRRLTALENQQ